MAIPHTAPPPAPPHLSTAKQAPHVAPKPKPAPESHPKTATEPAAEAPAKKEDPVPQKNPITVEDHLRVELANAWVSYANLKHAHWQTLGPLFRDLHLLFEGFATAVLDTIDDLAERLRMLDHDVDLIQLKEFQDAATVTSSVAGQDMREMLEEAHANAIVVIAGMRAAVAAAEKEGDPGSVDLFSKFVQIYEKQEWFTRQALMADDLC